MRESVHAEEEARRTPFHVGVRSMTMRGACAMGSLGIKMFATASKELSILRAHRVPFSGALIQPS